MRVITIIQYGHNLFIIANKIMAQQIKSQIGLGEKMTFTQKKLVRMLFYHTDIIYFGFKVLS